MIKSRKRNISGVLLLDKPYGISSNKALQTAKQLLFAAKCGHTGTLDPMATGLLPICFGEATKFSSMLLGADKTYEATLKLGFMSTTGDAEGIISQVAATVQNPTFTACQQTLSQFIGKIKQMPPMFSALKHHGKPLYCYARNGETIERQAREITIHGIQIRSLNCDELQLSIQCGTGTYVRVLAEDIGKALGCGGAYLTGLRRTAIDRFNLSQAYTLSALENMSASERDNSLLPIDYLLQDYPSITLDRLSALHIQQGRNILCPSAMHGVIKNGRQVRLYTEQDQFLGLGEITIEQTIAVKRLLSDSYLLKCTAQNLSS
ncbi:tRNA pseudouridine(55) synthase TruB [Nitrosomonas ureae]|uniref:tRNA pseudouridine synthase B n=1 Tax=Nitrosomonas ureae TaxID=44577 RepID=A0A1H5SWC2_9PROT|nr:tRNA pseudouridine(55) synthase TruB [Nitrosomonas ureae]SEF54922.1 tRNA pseudouridine synthase B [Nitrosomonas ureae]